MSKDFSDFPCNNCGWCCQRTPCPVALFLGQTPMHACTFLKETAPDTFKCGLLLEEKNPVKFEALKTLLLAGKGCSHIYGPSPISLMRELITRGLSPSHPQWELAKTNTISEYSSMLKESPDPESIHRALVEFVEFCDQQENPS